MNIGNREINIENKKDRKNIVNTIIISILVLIIIALVMVIVVMQSQKGVFNDDIVKLALDSEVECIDIVTPYVTLNFPKEWTDKIRIETIEGDIYKIKFYGSVEGKEEIELLELLFGGENGHTVGYLIKENIPVNLIYYNETLDDTWTPEQVIEVQEMHGAVEYVIDRLAETDNFQLCP